MESHWCRRNTDFTIGLTTSIQNIAQAAAKKRWKALGFLERKQKMEECGITALLNVGIILAHLISAILQSPHFPQAMESADIRRHDSKDRS
eukprot:scaffold174_cov98-Cylindrotheca_fusiformis.AAC.16